MNSHFLVDQPRTNALGAAVELLFSLPLIWAFHSTVFSCQISCWISFTFFTFIFLLHASPSLSFGPTFQFLSVCQYILMWRTGGPLFLRLCSHKIANACAVSHYISYSGIDTVLSTFPNTIVRKCAEFFWISRFWITCLPSSLGYKILKVSTTSTYVLGSLGHISFQSGYREVHCKPSKNVFYVQIVKSSSLSDRC